MPSAWGHTRLLETDWRLITQEFHCFSCGSVKRRVINCQKGAALMTETDFTYEKVGGCYEILPNEVLFDLAHENFTSIPMPEYTEEEMNLAKALATSLPVDQLKRARKTIGLDMADPYLHQDTVSKEVAKNYAITGSSDIGDVSWLMPFCTIFTATWPLGVNAHTWQSASASGSSLGQKGMLYAAKIMAGMFVDLTTEPELLMKAQEEFKKRTDGKAYVSPLGE